MATPKTRVKDGITYDKDGGVTLCWKGTRRVLESPTMGRFKAVKRMMLESIEQVKTLTGLTEDEIVSGKGSTDIKAQDLSDEWREKILREIFTDSPLPENIDEWPIWLATSDDIMLKIMSHWRTVPL